MPRLSEVTKRANAEALRHGLSRHYEHAEERVMGGVTYTVGEILAVFAKHVEAINAVSHARAALHGAVAAERAMDDEARTLRAWLFENLKMEFGADSPKLTEFGFAIPKKPGPKTAVAKARGAEKLRATRKARGTMGDKPRRKARKRTS